MDYAIIRYAVPKLVQKLNVFKTFSYANANTCTNAVCTLIVVVRIVVFKNTTG